MRRSETASNLGAPLIWETRAGGAPTLEHLLECAGGDSATDVVVQQKCMADMGKLGPSPRGDVSAMLCQQGRALHRS